MNKTSLILGIAAFAFGALTLHFGRQVYLQNAPTAPADSTPILAPLATVVAEDPVVPAVPAESATPARSAQLEAAIAQERTKLHGLERHLDLAPELWERVLQTYAEADCKADPACKAQKIDGKILASRAHAIEETVGHDVAAKITRYNNTLNERILVRELQTRLGEASALSTESAETFIAALAEENIAVRQELFPGVQTTSFSERGHGKVYFPIGEDSLDQRMEFAAKQSQRLRDRAGTMLTADQSVVFNQMQDELLAAFRTYLENGPNKPAP